MAYYDFAKELFLYVDEIEINHMIEYYQKRTKDRNPPCFEKLQKNNPSFFAPFIEQIEKKLKECDFQRNFLGDWKSDLKFEKERDLRCFDNGSDRDKEIARKVFEESYSNRISRSFDEVIDEIKNYPMAVDFRLHVLGKLYNYYRKRKSPYKELEGSRFEKYFQEKNIEFLNECKGNYNLVNCNGLFKIQKNARCKLHDEINDSDLFISEFLPDDYLDYLINLRKDNSFDLAVRPNYDICGDNLHATFRLDEGLIRGKTCEGRLNLIPEITWLVDYESQDRFIVYLDKGVVFEELLDDFKSVDNDCIVTQGVHIQYENEVITHLDHEFFFYTLTSYDEKFKDLKKHGHSEYKTFKIDNAKIPFEKKASDNILYKTLHAFFKNHALIDEYFEKMLQEK